MRHVYTHSSSLGFAEGARAAAKAGTAVSSRTGACRRQASPLAAVNSGTLEG